MLGACFKRGIVEWSTRVDHEQSEDLNFSFISCTKDFQTHLSMTGTAIFEHSFLRKNISKFSYGTNKHGRLLCWRYYFSHASSGVKLGSMPIVFLVKKTNVISIRSRNSSQQPREVIKTWLLVTLLMLVRTAKTKATT